MDQQSTIASPAIRVVTLKTIARNPIHRAKRWMVFGSVCSLLSSAFFATAADIKSITFDQPVSTHEWTLKEINPELPADWTDFDFLVVEWKASSSQRFELGLKTAQKLISKRIHPLAGVWVRASIPLGFYRSGLGNGNDLAATVN